jgi:pyruvate dehydrogenase (quinone)
MAKTVADGSWEMLVAAGVRRCHGIVGDALNPVIDALRRNGSVDFVHVRHEEWGVFAAVADARLTGHRSRCAGPRGRVWCTWSTACWMRGRKARR